MKDVKAWEDFQLKWPDFIEFHLQVKYFTQI